MSKDIGRKAYGRIKVKCFFEIPVRIPVRIADPVGFGMVASENHPGMNVTGILIRVDGLPSKHLEIARDLLPGAPKLY